MRKQDYAKHWKKIHKRSCGSKKQYPDRSSAFAAKRRYEQMNGAIMNVYQCYNCNKWHIGHQI
jgi:hypothetical protein